MADEELLTVAEVAEQLRLNQQTIRNWIDAGNLPVVRLGRRIRIRRSDLDALVGSEPGGSNEDLLTVDEVAGVLRVNPQTIRNWIESGKLEAVRVGRRVRVRRSELDRLLEPGPATYPSAADFWSGEPVGTALRPDDE